MGSSLLSQGSRSSLALGGGCSCTPRRPACIAGRRNRPVLVRAAPSGDLGLVKKEKSGDGSVLFVFGTEAEKQAAEKQQQTQKKPQANQTQASQPQATPPPQAKQTPQATPPQAKQTPQATPPQAKQTPQATPPQASQPQAKPPQASHPEAKPPQAKQPEASQSTPAPSPQAAAPVQQDTTPAPATTSQSKPQTPAKAAAPDTKGEGEATAFVSVAPGAPESNGKAPPAAVEEPVAIDLASLKVRELKKIAAEKKLTGFSKFNKEQLVELISEAAK